MKKKLIIRAFIALFAILSFAVFTSSCRNQNKKNAAQEQSFESVMTAFNNGHIRWGMTYEEIAAVCGKANSVFEGFEPGEILTAYYPTAYALEFDNGKFYILRYANGGLIEKDPNH